MATILPRLSITLSHEAHKLIADISALTGQTKSSMVSELLDSALPALHAMHQALEVAQRQPEEAQRLLARHANAATADLAQAQLALDDHLDSRTIRGKRGLGAKT